MGHGRVSTRAVAVGAGALAAKVALSAPRLAEHAPLVAITWLTVTSFVAVGLGLLATDVPRANGWACLVVAWATVPGDLNAAAWAGSWLSSLGFLLEGGYLPAAVALVLRYPDAALNRVYRATVAGLCFATIAMRVPVMVTTGPLPDDFYRPAGFPTLDVAPFWHDQLGVRGGRILTIALLLIAAGILVHRAVVSTGVSRQSLRPLILIAATSALAASADQATWVVGTPSAQLVPAAMVRDLMAATIPVALLIDLVQRRAARAAIVETVLTAAGSGSSTVLERALKQILVDPSARLRLPRAHDRWVSSDGHPASLPADDAGHRTEIVVADDGTVLTAVTCDPHSVTDETLLRNTLSAVRVGTHNLRLTADLLASMAELRESRVRIIEAGIAERRQVERDLHDGAQQQFLAVAATLAQTELVDDGRMREIVGEARVRLTAALTELRNLARGIHPAALTQGGLPAALPQLCTNLGHEVELQIDPDLNDRRPDAAVEVAAYFLVAEALTNAARHAHAERIVVSVRLDGADLRVDVRDDGLGTTRLVPGGGLAGLHDRLHALGGQLTVHDDPCPAHPGGRGTALQGVVPMRSGHDGRR